ncbi:hypothetical protein [Streptomyces sp. NPDC058145]
MPLLFVVGSSAAGFIGPVTCVGLVTSLGPVGPVTVGLPPG